MSSLELLSQSWADDCLPPEGVFPSREALYEAINKWALPRNYAFVVGRSRKDPANGRCTVTYACDRGCKPPDPSDKRKRKTSTRGTECPFSIIAKEARDSSWQLKHRDPKYHQHNHEPSLHPLAHPAHRKMAAQEKACISQLATSRIHPKEIQIYLREQGIPNLTIRQDIQNRIAETRREICEGQSAIHALINQLEEESFWSRIRFDDKGRVMSVLFAHPQSLEYLQAYPDVLLLDCTYNTNKFNMPLLDMVGVDACQRTFCIAFAFLSGETEDDYYWVLDRLKSMYETIHVRLPAVILTDRCLACINAATQVFPISASLLCLWHANKAVLSHCLPIFAAQERLLSKLSSRQPTDEKQSFRWKEFYSCWHNIINSPTEAAFNKRVKAFEAKYIDSHIEEVAYVKEIWLEPYKEKLVKAWVDQYAHFGNVATSRVEGIHSIIKDYIGTSQLDLFEVWRQIKNAILNQLLELTHHQSYQQTQMPLEISGNLYSIVRGWVSLEAIRKVEEQRKLIDAENSPLSRPCTGRFTASYGLPCVHRVKALIDAKLPLALDEFHTHWRYKREGQPIHLIEPQRLERYRKEGSRVPISSTQREKCAFEATEPRRKQLSKCTACGVIGHTRVSRLCPQRYEYLKAESLNAEPERDSSPTDEALLELQLLQATTSTAGVRDSHQPRDSPEAIYQAYVENRQKWYSGQPGSRGKTDRAYRKASNLPTYSKTDYQWCENWKQMGQFCKSEKRPRKWTKEEKTAYLDWSKKEDERVEAAVALEFAKNPRGRRGIGHIYDIIAEDDREQEALFEASRGRI
uniref:MULE transposase domain-containing protein n=1 Tax=Photinus pyralis TaxID=7054 RepID=A0A1Y1NIF4_PHOPY